MGVAPPQGEGMSRSATKSQISLGNRGWPLSFSGTFSTIPPLTKSCVADRSPTPVSSLRCELDKPGNQRNMVPRTAFRDPMPGRPSPFFRALALTLTLAVASVASLPTAALSRSSAAETAATSSGQEIVEALTNVVALSALPVQAQDVHRRIHAGGPFRYEKDGTVFGNRERLLPRRPRGFYREYTVPTPGARNRGARRIVCGGKEVQEPETCFYTRDHYASFQLIDPKR